jgi:hypothetical protein
MKETSANAHSAESNLTAPIFAVACVAWFDAVVSRLLAAWKKQCWRSMVIGCPIPGREKTEEG